MRILFLAHEASATGAVRLLLDIQRWLANNSEIEFATVFIKGGAQFADFENTGRVIGRLDQHRPVTLADRIARKLGRHTMSQTDVMLDVLRREAPFDILYCNTIVSAPAITLFYSVAKIVVSHIHELPMLVRSFGDAGIDAVRRYASHYIAGSTAVKCGLVDDFNIDASIVNVVNGFISPSFGIGVDQPKARAALRRRLNLPVDALVVGVCGTGALHKGHDLLPQVVERLPAIAAGREVHLVHVGQFASHFEKALLERDAELLGVAQRLHFVGPQANPDEWAAGFDVLAFPSREDAFGLVLLEAARFAVPAVCFDGSGGAPELCANGAGVTVPYLRPDLMASAVAALLLDDGRRQAMGRRARDQLFARYQADTAMPAWLALMKTLVTARNA